MKISIVGCGNQGSGLAALLALEADVDTLVLADYDPGMAAAAKAFIESMGSRAKTRNIVTAKVDAGNRADVARVIEGTDLVFNGIVPTYNIPIMQACLDKGAHYLDLFGLPFEGHGVSRDETIGAQFDLSDQFAAKGLIAVPSVGMSPGWTSLAAEHMMRDMDTVDEVIIRWADWLDTDVYIAPIAPIVIFHEWFGPPYPIRMQDGAIEEVDLIQSEEAFEFPDPIGVQNVYTVTAHADVVLIDKFSDKKIGRIEEKGAIILGKMPMKDVWIKAVREQTAKNAGNANLDKDMMAAFAESFISPIKFKEYYDKGLIRDAVLSFTVECRGKISGKPVRHITYYTSDMNLANEKLPGVSHSVYGTVGGTPIELVLRICRGEIAKRGVLGLPELGITDALLQAMADRGQLISEKIIKGM